MVRKVHAVPAVALVAHPHGLAVVVARRVRHRRRRRERLVRVAALVPLGGHEVRMDRLVRQVEEERPLPAPALQPVDGVVGELVGDVAALRHGLAVDVEPVARRQIGALPSETHPPIEPGLRRIALAAHVPLAHKGGVVPGGLQVLRKERRAGGNRRVVVDDAMAMRVLAGEHRRAAWRTERRGDKRVWQAHAAPGKRIDVRRLEPRVPGDAHRVEAQVVDEHEDDVAADRSRDRRQLEARADRLAPQRLARVSRRARSTRRAGPSR